MSIFFFRVIEFFVLHRMVGRTWRGVLTPGYFEPQNFPSVGKGNSSLGDRGYSGKSSLDLGRVPKCYLSDCRGPGNSVVVVQSLNCVQLFVTPWAATCQASLSITNSQSLLKLMPIESVMPFNHLILCLLILLLPSVFPSIRVFSRESALNVRWPEYWGFSISPEAPVLQD